MSVTELEDEFELKFDDVLDMYRQGVPKHSMLSYTGLDENLQRIECDRYFNVGETPKLNTYFTKRVLGSPEYRYNKIVTVLGDPGTSDITVSVIIPVEEIPYHMSTMAVDIIANEVFRETTLYDPKVTPHMYQHYMVDAAKAVFCEVTGHQVFIILMHFLKDKSITLDVISCNN